MGIEWYEDEHWADMKLATAGTVRELYPTDPHWLRRWTCYAEFMAIAVDAYGQADDLYQELGDPHLRIYQDVLDPEKIAMSREDVGRFLLTSVTSVISRLRENPALFEGPESLPEIVRQAGEAISAWYYALEYPGNRKKAATQWYATVDSQKIKSKESAERVMRDRLWRKGLAAPHDYAPYAAPGWRALTYALDDQLQPYARTGTAGDADILDQLLPRSIAESVRNAADKLKDTRNSYPPELMERLGIDENGYTTLMAEALPKLRDCVAKGESMLVLGPTSSGKSRIGRIAVCHAITKLPHHGRAIVLLPTKALVNQAVDEWREFLEGTPYSGRDEDSDAGWRILPGSRDYPHNDEAIARRDFDIAVMIPEKLAGLMAGGMTLDGCDVLIVDELQNLADAERGPRLEMLLTSIQARYKIPMIGLSATLTADAAEQVRTWLNIDPSAVIRTAFRPVPLDLLVCDDLHARALTAEGKVEPSDLDLRSLLRGWDAKSSLEPSLGRVRAFRRALALAVTLLKEDGALDSPAERSRRVLCFVGSRQNAQDLAEVAQAVLDSELGPMAPDGNPFRGRFSRLTEEAAIERNRALRRYPQTTLRDDVVKALRTGVGYHSARLEPDMRSEIEKGFREGLIRLLFATDTLKLGINLPADAVVVASVTTPTGKRNMSRVLDRDTVAQRLGRAGRLGLSARGYGYLVVPDERPVKTRVEVDDFELEHLAELVPALPAESQLDRALRALIEVDAVFKHYIGYIGDNAALGAAITSRVDEMWFATELLHWAVREGAAFSRDQLERQLDVFYDASLGKVTGVPAPDHARVITMLLDNALLGPEPTGRQTDRPLAVTGLGRAVSTSGLPFSDAAIVEQMMRAGLEGAGDLTLLWLAAQSRHVRRSTTWISLASEDASGDQNREALQRDLLRRLAGVFAAAPADRAARLQAAGLRSAAFAKALPERDLIGDGEAAGQLLSLITGPAPDPGPVKINALLRACVLQLWKEGCPLKDLEDAIQENLKTPMNGSVGQRTVTIHAADVRNLGENTSYLFDAARELTGVRPKGQIFRRFESLGESVEFGVPPILLPLVRLHRRETHRERVVELVPVLRVHPHRARFDSAADLVDQFMRRGAVKPGNRALAAKLAQVTLTDKERENVRKGLEKIESRRQGLHVLAQYRDKMVPGIAGYNLEEALGPLRNQGADDTARYVVDLLKRYGLSVRLDPDDSTMIHLASRTDPGLTATLAIRTTLVNVENLEQARGTADIVLACAGATDGVRMADLRSGRNNPVVIQPAVLLEAAARINDLMGPKEESSEDLTEALIAQADGAMTTDEGEPPTDLDWDELDDGRADDPGVGYETVGHHLLERLTAAPPMLGRTELNRLIAGITVGPPPAMLAEPAGSAASEGMAAR